MCLLNHCSVQTEFSDINPTETVAISNLNSKILLQSFLLPVLIFITLCFAAPAAVSQETTDSDLSQSLEEDPFAESDPELGTDEDPLAESDPELGADEDPFAESDPELGLDEDPLAESDSELQATLQTIVFYSTPAPRQDLQSGPFKTCVFKSRLN